MYKIKTKMINTIRACKVTLPMQSVMMNKRTIIILLISYIIMVVKTIKLVFMMITKTRTMVVMMMMKIVIRVIAMRVNNKSN